MTYKSVADVIEALRATSSSNEKLSILKEHKDMPDLDKVFLYAYNPYYRFGVRVLPEGEVEKNPFTGVPGTQAFWYVLDSLRERKYTGKRAEEQLLYLQDFISEKDRAILQNILYRDMDCGVSVTTINKVWEGLIPIFSIAKASPYSGVSFPAQAEIKMNGNRVLIFYRKGVTTIYSSNGNTADDDTLINLRKEIKQLCVANDINSVVFDGELTSSNRRTVSGVFNKALKGTLTEKEELEAELLYTVFDILPYRDWESGETYPQSVRNKQLDKVFSKNTSKSLAKVSRFIVNSESELQSLFHKVYKEQGEEGLIVKDMEGYYSFTRDSSWQKLKGINEADLKIVGYLGGTGKRQGKVGSILCESSDGKVAVAVGSGLTDSDVEYFTNNKDKLLGRVITVLYNEMIVDKEGQYSLFLPRFVELREQGKEADSFEKISAEGNGAEL